MDILNEILNIELSGAEIEQSSGDFNVDLVAEDADGNPVVIENQLEKSDHQHLGKLISYKTALDAKSAIWIAAEPRPEHVNAINWFNESSDSAFYLVKVEAIRIGESDPAPLFTLIGGPSEESKQIGETKKDLSGRYEKRHHLRTALLKRASGRTRLLSGRSPSKYHYISTGAGRTGLTWDLSIGKEEAKVELYIDRGKDCGEENKAIFDELFASKDVIGRDFGEPLEWQRLEGKRACRILYRIQGGYSNEEGWEQLHDKMIDALIRLEKAIGPKLKKLSI